MHYKALKYESINIDLKKRQNQQAEYLKINRHGLVPAIIHNNNIIVEANLINELKILNNRLENKEWLCRKNYTLADIAWTAGIYRLKQLEMLDILNNEKFDALLQWYEKIKKMDHFCGYDF